MDPTQQDTRTDEELIKMCQQGDLSAFDLIVRKWDSKVLNLAYRLIGNEEDAKDIRQQTFVNVYRSIASFNGKAKFSTWVYRIAINLCKNEFDKKRRRKTLQLKADYVLRRTVFGICFLQLNETTWTAKHYGRCADAEAEDINWLRCL